MSKEIKALKKTFKSKESEYVKKYYNKNREKWLRKVECKICNCKVGLASLSRHKRSKKHLMKLNKGELSNEDKKFIEDNKMVKYRKCKLDKLRNEIELLSKQVKELLNKSI